MANGVDVELVPAGDAREIDPHARTHELALWSPTTSSVSPKAVIDSLVQEAMRVGIEIRTGTAYESRHGGEIRTSRGSISAGFVVNAAGLYADRIAREFGFSEEYRILPFKGLYLEAVGSRSPLRTHIYPVPELRYPFLGVHFTIGVGGETKIGPTAIPVLWREQYDLFSNFRLAELAQIGHLQADLFVRNEMDFRRLARREVAKYSRRHLVELASGLVSEDVVQRRWKWGKPGIRAQLMNIADHRLEMDFRVQHDDRSLHVLNAVSPAFTCAFPFARFLVDQVVGSSTGRAVAGASA
jgi:L-2-hydroxyglutarate oxidase LhgO